MTDSYVKAGYGKATVFTHCGKVQALTVYPDHLELIKRSEWTLEQRKNDPSLHSEPIRCSFCGNSVDQAEHMIAGNKSYICDECIKMCAEILADLDSYKKQAESDKN